MGKEFRRLKRYNVTWSMLRTLMLGLSLALLLLGAILALDKVHVIQADTVHYVLAMVCALVAMGIYAVVQRKSDQRIAEKIDAEHKLRERVQTMVQYQNDESAMLQVQREDTEARLKAVRRFGQKRLTLAAHFVLVLVAFAVFAVGVVMPVQAVPQPTVPTEPPYEVSDWQKGAVQQLIVHVQESNMVDAVKTPTVEDLQNLLKTLDTKLTASALKEKVASVIINVYRNTDDVNSNDDIHAVIINVCEHNQAADLAYSLGALHNAERAGQIEVIRVAMEKDKELATAGDLADQLDEALAMSIYNEEDALYAAVAEFAAGLHAVADALAAEDADGARQLLGSTFGKLKNSASNALEQQDATKEECLYVVDTLCEIFSLSGKDRPGDPDPEILKQQKEEEVGSNAGGFSPGGELYAGDDEVYNYREHTYAEYGPLFKEYYHTQALDDMKEMDESLRELVEKYINEILVKKDEN